MINNNRFKFRVWDVVSKSYYKWHQSNQLALRPSGHVTDGSISIDSQYLQFSTGLKDSKNKLIFEGDIVECLMSKGPNCLRPDYIISEREHRQVNQIIWGNYSDGEYVDEIECWMFGVNSLSELIFRTKGSYHEYIRIYTVIGNVFEHADLLK